MSWNVWWRFGRSWAAREVGIHDVVGRVGPDLLGLQESWSSADGSQADSLATRTGGYGLFQSSSIPPLPEEPETPDQVGVDIGVGLVSRWPVLEARGHRLPAVHGEPPTALVATVDHPRGPLHVIVACTQWQIELRDDHLAQMKELAVLMADPAFDGDLPVVLLGDLNARPGTPEIALLDSVATDLWTAGGGDEDAVTLSSTTPHAPLEAVRQIDRRIDYAFARPGRPGQPILASGSTLAGTQPVNGTFPSDHFATVSDLDEYAQADRTGTL
ncbi:endonuclease/exonuclease/phosphatase family protein [uncultured Cellulomonas sp.]|uniref:endonuclease/exonuclease/phosphatase family protein n=1 Tax=uncultured Cellulomonas sp. TaxID=189682 RepID=UPI0028E54B91|nr:endonuclease/exonuclease/phosphatase family protein [uncultured Cellulomonas sp.]